MAERLIRESDVIKLIDEWLDNYPLPRHVEKGLMSHEELLAYIAEAPTIEAKPVVHAHWEEIANGFMVCSHCEESVEENRKYSYCPICGAQMDEVVSDNNVGSKTEGVKIPVISMEDVQKLAKEMEK